MQAIECGLPVITMEGRFMRGRLASGLLRRLGMDDLIAESESDYVAKVVDFAQDDQRRKRVSEQIASRRDSLFGDVEAVRSLEDHLTQISLQARR
jgi:predicted O-linked N-acetylglucosamine transferase (SPINDLY family)